MSFVRYGFFLIVLALMSGCTSVTVKPVDSALDIRHVCVKDCSENCFDGGMLSIIQDGFQRHGITTEVYTGDLKPECEYSLTYYCERTWDLAIYMHHAELRLYHGNSLIGNAEYRLRGQGGFSLNKWASTKSKMDPVIDNFLSGF